ncbi:hypothetical protein P7K49_015310, partial [Saguinus oedipus]
MQDLLITVTHTSRTVRGGIHSSQEWACLPQWPHLPWWPCPDPSFGTEREHSSSLEPLTCPSVG